MLFYIKALSCSNSQISFLSLFCYLSSLFTTSLLLLSLLSKIPMILSSLLCYLLFEQCHNNANRTKAFAWLYNPCSLRRTIQCICPWVKTINIGTRLVLYFSLTRKHVYMSSLVTMVWVSIMSNCAMPNEDICCKFLVIEYLCMNIPSCVILLN